MKNHERTNPHDAAFGHAAENGHCCGLTKREYFAAMAMQGQIVNPVSNGDDHDQIARFSVAQADALVAALNTEGKP